MSEWEKVGLGTVQFGMDYGVSNTGGQTSREEVSRILTLAKSRGVRLLDTASAYGNAEEILGEQDLGSFEVVSKFMPSSDRQGITGQLKKSLTDLGLDALYGYLAHRPSGLLQNPDDWRELEKVKGEGLVKKIGFSLNSPSELPPLLAAGFVPDLVQVPYNYADRRFEETAVMLRSRGCEIHVRSVFLQGLFFRPVNSLGSFFNTIKPLIERLQVLGQHLPGALLEYVLQKPFVDRVIVGVVNASQLDEIFSFRPEGNMLPDAGIELPEKVLMPSGWPEEVRQSSRRANDDRGRDPERHTIRNDVQATRTNKQVD